MDASTASLAATPGLLVALGMRHGMDADHVAAIDGLTRLRYKAHMAVLDALWQTCSVWIGVSVTSAVLFMLAKCSWYFQSKADSTKHSTANNPVAQ
jgi:hypothetical protein